MEANPNVEMLRKCVSIGLQYMIQLSMIPEEELFKICIEFWHWLTHDVMMKMRGHQFFDPKVLSVPGLDFSSAPSNAIGNKGNTFLHQNVYKDIFNQLRQIMFDQMAKPDEVLITIDECGEVEEEHIEDLEAIQLYEKMRETLI